MPASAGEPREGINMATVMSAPAGGSGVRVHIQRFGTFLSSMIMPNIGAIIAWGLITAFFIDVGWTCLLYTSPSPRD